MSRRVRWVVAVAVVVPLAAVMAFGLWRWEGSRDPKLRDDLAAMDQGIAAVLGGAGDDAAVAVSGPVRAATCSLGVLRSGGRYSRAADLYVPAGQEDALLGRIASRLPAAYQARREAPLTGSVQPLDAAPSPGVQLTVRSLGPGWLVAEAQTGCVDGPAQPVDPSPAADDPGVAAIREILGGLGSAPAGFSTASVPCFATVAGYSGATDSGHLADRVTVPAGARTFTAAASNRIAYRQGSASVVVDATDDGTAVTVRRTTGC